MYIIACLLLSIPILATHTRYVTSPDYNIVVVRTNSYSSLFRTNILGLGLVRINIVSFRLVQFLPDLLYCLLLL